MCKNIKMVPSLKREENDEVVAELDKLVAAKGISLEIIGGLGILDEHINLPFIATDEGDEAYGVKAVKRLIAHQLQL